MPEIEQEVKTMDDKDKIDFLKATLKYLVLILHAQEGGFQEEVDKIKEEGTKASFGRLFSENSTGVDIVRKALSL